MKRAALLAVLGAAMLSAQVAPSGGPDPWATLRFLEGTWDARTQGESSGVNASGTYTFRTELAGHILARHSSSASCKGPDDFNCEHGDLLYIYVEAAGQPLKAIYFDNEGHVIHYSVSTPTPTTAIFLSDASSPGPRFRLIYERKGTVMTGKFQMQLPGQTEWKFYLEWSGAQK